MKESETLTEPLSKSTERDSFVGETTYDRMGLTESSIIDPLIPIEKQAPYVQAFNDYKNAKQLSKEAVLSQPRSSVAVQEGIAKTDLEKSALESAFVKSDRNIKEKEIQEKQREEELRSLDTGQGRFESGLGSFNQSVAGLPADIS